MHASLGARLATAAGWALVGVVSLGAGMAAASETYSTAENAAGWEALAEPGAVAIMRHALAPGTGDPADVVDPDDCSTQRNLNAVGRDQARLVGDRIDARGIAFDRVLAGAWCRVRQTAELMDVGEVEHFAPLDDVYHRLETRDEQTAALRDFLADLPAEERVLMVTHQLNITGLTGLPALSGEILVLDVAADGAVAVTGHIVTPPPAAD